MNFKLPIAAPDVLEPEPGGDDESRLLRVGDLAQRTQKTVRALHLYEELGLLRPSERSKGNYRLYNADAVVRVRWISKLQEMGFSLPEIREVLQEWEASGSATHAMKHVRALYAQKLEDTRRQIERLTGLHAELQRSVDYLDTCETCDPERLISSCPRCELHACHAPELIAGLHRH